MPRQGKFNLARLYYTVHTFDPAYVTMLYHATYVVISHEYVSQSFVAPLSVKIITPHMYVATSNSSGGLFQS